MDFDPKTTKYPYPEDTAAHYLVLKKNAGIRFDAAYPFVDRSPLFRARQAVTRFLLYVVGFPVMRARMGLLVRGKENLKKHREVIRKGCMTCSNHVHLWDYMAVMYALGPKDQYVLAWDRNINGENGFLIRSVGGIPIPVGNFHGSVAMTGAVGETLARGGRVHVYSEGSMWEYYRPIRPFKDGTASLACRFGVPILPMAFSYRRPGWIRRTVFRQIALFTLTVGEPLYPDPALPRDERKEDLTRRCHEAVCRLAGIDPEKDPYPPVYRNDRRRAYDRV